MKKLAKWRKTKDNSNRTIWDSCYIISKVLCSNNRRVLIREGKWGVVCKDR